jgi:hypothetical protein
MAELGPPTEETVPAYFIVSDDAGRSPRSYTEYSVAG